MTSVSRHLPGWRVAATAGLAGAVVLGLTTASTTANAATNVLDANQSVTRACHGGLLPPGTQGTDRREISSTVDGLVQARLQPTSGAEGDWDLAVYDKATGAVVAASAALRSRELAESFVSKDQVLVVQGCRYAGSAKSVTLSVDFLALTPQGTPTAAQRAQLVRVQTPDQQAKDRLLTLGLDVTEKADATGVEVVLAGDADRRILADAGMGYSVIDADLSATSIANAKADKAYAASTAASGLPSGRTGYRHLYDYNYELKELARSRPSLVRAFTLPEQSWEGRDVVAAEITPDVAKAGDGKAVNFVMGVHHAREWPAGEHAMEWAHELVNGYGRDQQIRDLVSRTRNLVVPIVNVDGFSISREAEPNGDFSRFDYEMKRKNCNVNDSPEQYRAGVCTANPAGRLRGTDPNRNYAGFWGGPGASTNWSSDTFRGSGPFSEPETRNIRWLVSNRQVTNLLTLHTYSNLVLRVPSLADTPRPLDEVAYRALGAQVASRNGYTNQAAWQLYDTSGSTEDWSYWTTGGFGFTFEIGPDEFHPTFQSGVVAEYLGQAPAAGAGRGGNRAAFIDMMTNAATPAAHSTLVGSAPDGYELTLHKSFQTPTAPIIQPDGSVRPPIYYTDTLNSTLRSTGGRFAWAVNPSTRPYVAGQYGRDPQGPPQGPLTVANPAGQPAENTNYPMDPTAERVTFHVDGMPAVDNGRMNIQLNWTNPDTDWDIYILDAQGNQVASAASFGANYERAVMFDPPAGDYTAVIVNFDQVDGEPYDDWTSLDVTFDSPTPAVYGPKESYQLTCKNRNGRLVGVSDVFVDRGQTVDVGDVCTDANRQRKNRR